MLIESGLLKPEPMQRRAFVARLKREARQAYVEAHRNVWPELVDRYRAAGYRRCSIYLDGDDLFMLVEAPDIAAVEKKLEGDPVDARWQQVVEPMMAETWRELPEIYHWD